MLSETTSNSRRPGRLVLISVSLAIVLAACSDAVAATEGGAPETTNSTEVTDPDGGFLDESVVHQISVEFDPAEYEAMIEVYVSTDEKEWIEATVTIDGTTYESVGMRLKGNSSLRGLGDGEFDTSADSPEDLPWLIRLDEFVEGQSHDGIVELVVRSNNSATALNEAVALDVLEEAGLASQDSAYASFAVNGSDEVLRLIVENPDDVWLDDAFDGQGILYKAESTGDYSYRGDDPASYDEVFDIEAGEDNGDMTPLIEFLEFINESDDETFNSQLGDYLDVEAFATYLATEDLIGNFDDIDGPGNNSYLYYDTTTETFTVVPWDHNLAFGGMNGGAGGGFGPGRPDDADMAPPTDGGEGFAPPEGERPSFGQSDGPESPAGERPDFGGIAGGGGPGGSNILVERFLANPEWQDLYDTAATRLQNEIFTSGEVDAILDKWMTVLEDQASDLVSAETVSDEASAVESSMP